MAEPMDSTSNEEAARLAEQYKYVNSALGFTIHPTIKTALKQVERKLRIADVSLGHHFAKAIEKGCRDVPFESYSLEHVELDDVLKGVPNQSLRGQFDIVAVRFLHTRIDSENWPAVTGRLCDLLRPSGWLQWVDWDPLTVRVAAVKPGASDTAIRNVFHVLTDLLRAKKIGNTHKIPTALRAIGMQEDDSDMYALNPEVQFTRNVVTGALNILERSEIMSVQQLSCIREQIDQEISLGDPLLWYDLWIHIAKKPASV